MPNEECIVVKFSEGLGIFDQHYGYPQMDNQEIYDGPTGKVIDIQGIQAHAGHDYFFVPEGKEFSLNIDQCPYLHIAIKAEPGTSTCLFLLVHERKRYWRRRFIVIGKTPQGDCLPYLMSNYFTIEDDNKWQDYVYDLRKIPNAGSIRRIQFHTRTGSGAHTFHFNCLLCMKDKRIKPGEIEKQYSEFLHAQIEMQYLQKKISRMSELPQKDLAVASERICARYSELSSQVEDYEKSKCFRPTWSTERRKRTLAESPFAEAYVSAYSIVNAPLLATIDPARERWGFWQAYMAHTGLLAKDECPEVVRGTVYNPTAFKEYIWGPPHNVDAWTFGGSDFCAIGPADNNETLGTQKVGDYSQATGAAFRVYAFENAKNILQVLFGRGINGISTLGVLQYTLPPPPCDMTVYWEAIPSVCLPKGVHVSAEHGFLDIDFVSFGQNPAAGFPGFKRFEWTPGLHFSETNHNPIEFAYDVKGSFHVPKGVRTRVYIGVAIQVIVVHGNVCTDERFNSPITDTGIFEVISDFFYSGGPKARYKDRVAPKGELVKYPGVHYRMVRE